MTTISAPTLRSFTQLFVGGRWVAPSTDDVIDVISPLTEQVIATVPAAGPADVDAAVAAAREAFDHGPWPRMTPAERGEALARVGDELEKRLDELVASFTAEVGGPTALSTAFHTRAAAGWREMSDLIDRTVFEEERSGPGGTGVIVREPVGVVGAIIPWNGPVTTGSNKLRAALAAGCTVVLKPAPEGPVATLILAEALSAAGLPEGVVSILPGGRETGEHLVSHRDVDKITFTGSTAAGRRIMALCAERIVRVTLELGGKSAGIIADDVDLSSVIPTLLPAGVGHSGQVCAAITRILVPRERQQELLDALVPAVEGMVLGDPADPATQLGPLVAERQRDRVESYIRVGVEEGARLVTGGERPDGPGWFVEPTVFADVSNDMRIAREEIFGPVVCVIPFDSVDEAVDLANDSDYGLSGAVYAKDPALAEAIARRIRTGQIAINGWTICGSQPFGGFKQSGIGREGGAEGLEAYLETKWIHRG
ncbi:aldehyde dehydrogenase [Actinomycetospora endophytica]|uniref:aldehyde dehydrogenase (NAD(+)) n=1 Tax=Actinomycetospora endophytica TaxID=2291215 RepID=A0ABS8PB62_9PSEU|nr:aldehyde dehydrogenase [Actinomycetospora endophytica]MCD2195349.1 aldehyde dehydrogenase [Actinomycetospora endophytica]